MSAVKRKLRNKSLKQECEIIRHIKKGMTKKEASKNFRVRKISFNVDKKTKRNVSPYCKKLHRPSKKYEDVITKK